MHIDTTDIVTGIVLALAVGRIAYSLTQDEIFRPLREWVWLRSAPESAALLRFEEDGDSQWPARMVHHYSSIGRIWATKVVRQINDDYGYAPTAPMRKPGFFGQLIECFYCVSFWLALVASIAWWLLGDNVIYAALPFAFWAGGNYFAHRLNH